MRFFFLYIISCFMLIISCRKDNVPSKCCENEPFEAQFDGYNFYIPTAFSPNGNLLNDYFGVFIYIPNYTKRPEIKEFIIRRPNGEIVHERYNFDPRNKDSYWDGIIGGKYTGGLFKYKLIIEGQTGETLEHEGEFCSITGVLYGHTYCFEDINECSWPAQNFQGTYSPNSYTIYCVERDE